jgi:superfamily II DNA/RNA helicase
VYAKLRQVIGGSIGDTLLTKRPAKLEALLDDIEDHEESAVIVAYFRQDLKVICDALAEDGHSFGVLHGDVKPADRDIAIDGFNAGKIRFLVGQHDLLAQGLNLQKQCALMYTYSVSLVAETQSQYHGRIDRNGQTRRPVFKHLIAKGTIDERIHKMIRSNLNVQRIFSSMSKKEMINLLLND